MDKKPRWPAILQLFGPFIGLAAVIALFCLSGEVREVMFTGGNMKMVLTQSVVVAIGALGMTMIIVSGGIDLSAGSIIACSGVIGATLIAEGFSTPVVIILTVLSGGLFGLVNGAIIAGCKMVPFIVTLGMMGIARGMAKWVANEQTVNYPNDHAVNALMRPENPLELLPLQPGIWIALVLAILMTVVMRYSVFGRRVFAIGSNESTARLCGISVWKNKVLIYTLAGLFFGVAGLMLLSRLSQGDPTIAVGLELEIIAAVVIGGASLNGGSGSILGSMIGAIIMVVLKSGSSQMGWPDYLQQIIIGFVIILAVGIDKLRQQSSAK